MKFSTRARRKLRFINTRLKEGRMIARGLLSTEHPVLAHVIPIRRCNLSCAYCNEYDDFSKPVPLEEMLQRIDRLAELGATIITQSGGEPLLHPDLDNIIARVRSHGILAGMITNGYLLTRERIERLNRAGLEHLQISIDNAMPDETSKKSLKVLDQKLVLLSEYAEFQVNINSVLGCGIRFPEDALKVARRALELGFTSTIGVLHDGNGQLKALSGKANEWRCRSGARYLYICEDGLVHWCSQQRGYPGIPLMQYGLEDFRREFNTAKPCAPHCTVSCSQQVAMLDNWRAPQTLRPNPAGVPAAQGLVQLTGARASEHD